MICTYSGKKAKYCTGPKNIGWYTKGCRCTAAKSMARKQMAGYKGLYDYRATCPICGGRTKRSSGMCRGCEVSR